jgi:hypothetical protein
VVDEQAQQALFIQQEESKGTQQKRDANKIQCIPKQFK